MKRLLGLTGLTCFAVLTACFYLGQATAIAIGCGGLVLFIVSMCISSMRREGTFPIAFASVLCSVLLFFGFTHIVVMPVHSAYNEVQAEVRAIQKRETYYSYGYYCYELDVISIDGEKVNTGLLLRSKEAVFSEPYDELSFTCELNPTDYDADLSKGLYLHTYMFEEPEVNVTSPDKKPFMYHVISLREDLRRALYLEMDSDTADFSSALLLGDKHAVDVEVKELLRICGLSHISVVSGLHLSILAAVWNKIMMFITRRNKYISGVSTILLVMFFMLLTGFGIPVVRSGVMLIILTVGKMINRQSDSMNSIGAAALLLCLTNPYSVGDVGMLLSFLATIGIVLWCNKISSPILSKLSNLRFMDNHRINKAVRFLVFTFSCSLSAILWTLPVNIIFFGGFSLVALLANLLVVPLINIVLDMVALTVITYFIPLMGIVTHLCAFSVELFYDYLIFVCKSLSKFPVAYVSADKPYFYFALVATFVLVAVAMLIRTKTAFQLTAIFSLLILLFGSASYHLSRQNFVTLYIPDTGGDLSVVAESSDGHAVLTCGGSRGRVYVLNNLLAELTTGDNDILVVTPRDSSRLYSENITNEFDYPQILRYDNSRDSSDSEYGLSEAETCFSGDYDLHLWGKATASYLTRGGEVFQYLTIADTEVLILPDGGDCAELEEEYRSPDIIIAERVITNMGLLSCDTLIIPGDDYMAQATAPIGAPIAENVITGKDIIYDIKIN